MPEYRLVKGKHVFDDDLQLGWFLEAISRVLDRKLNQPFGFNKDAAPTSLLYVGSGSRLLPVAPIASAAGLVIKVNQGNDGDFSGETPFGASDYSLYPLTTPAGEPWTQIYLPTWSSYGYFPAGYQVQVTAIFGWPSVPRAIQWATIELAAMLAGDSIFTAGRVSEIDQVVDAAPQARALLKSLSSVYNQYPIAVA